MSASKIAFLAPIPEYEEDWSHIKADYLRLFDAGTAFIDWTKADGLAAFDFVTPLLAWGYQRDCPRWFALLDRLEAEGLAVCNPVSVLRWNSDKAYLAELDAGGVATVPTLAQRKSGQGSARRCPFDVLGTDTLVVKPPISGGADGTFRLSVSDAIPERVAGKRMMIQPYMEGIAAEGEYSLFYFGGTFSHAIIKRPARRRLSRAGPVRRL